MNVEYHEKRPNQREKMFRIGARRWFGESRMQKGREWRESEDAMRPRYEPSKAPIQVSAQRSKNHAIISSRPTFPAACFPRYANTTGLGIARYPTVEVDDACVFVELDMGGIE